MFIKLLLFINIANASFNFRDEVHIKKECFVNLHIFKCQTYKYMILKKQNNTYNIGPARYETIPSLCALNNVKESCITLVNRYDKTLRK